MPDLLDRFGAVSRHVERLAGRLDARDHSTALDLVLASAEAVEGYLRTRRDDALGRLEFTLQARPGDVVTEIYDCWRPVGSQRPVMLLVEENFSCFGPRARLQGTLDMTVSTKYDEVHDLVDA